jgi:hypothetical protein
VIPLTVTALPLPIFLLLLEWFYQHPALRYGGYCLIAGPILIFLTGKISSHQLKFAILKKRIIFLFSIVICIFLAKNITRIFNEYQKYEYNPFVSVNYKITNADFGIYNEIKILKKNMLDCSELVDNCNKDVRGYIMSKFSNQVIIKINDQKNH